MVAREGFKGSFDKHVLQFFNDKGIKIASAAWHNGIYLVNDIPKRSHEKAFAG
jgi:hypothetical protein